MKRRQMLQQGLLVTLSLVDTAVATPGVVRPPGIGPAARRRRHYVDCRYGQMHVTSTAPGGGRSERPAVICLPMSPRSGRDFDDFAAALAIDRWVHSPDVPGFGGSDAPLSPPTLDEYAAALVEGISSLRAAGSRPPFDIVGQHTGAALAIEIARQAPKLVRRLVLIGVPMFSADQAAALREKFATPRPYFEDPEFLAKAWQRELPTLANGLSKERLLLRFTEIMRAGFSSWWGFNAVFNYPLRERIVQVHAPMQALILNELLAEPSREAMQLAPKGSSEDMIDLPGSALDFATERLVAASRAFFDAA